jgi:hypothetical protein
MKRLLIVLFTLLILGCSRELNEMTGPDTTPPSPPQGLSVYFAGDGMVILVWQNNTEPDVDFYRIYRSSDSINFFNIGQSYENIFSDKGLDYDSVYYYYITAVDNSGNESQPSSIVSAKPVNKYPPTQPFGLSVDAHNDPDGIYFNLKWYKNPDGDIKLYRVHRSTTQNFTPSDLNLVGWTKDNYFRDTVNLSVNQRYFYKIVAVDKGGLESKPSYEDDDIILKCPSLLNPQDNGTTDYNPVFKWKKVENASGYIIFVSTSKFGNEIWKKVITGENSDTLSVTYLGPSLYDGRIYFWKVATFTKSENMINSISETRSFRVSIR